MKFVGAMWLVDVDVILQSEVDQKLTKWTQLFPMLQSELLH